jgi:hypothetical protein
MVVRWQRIAAVPDLWQQSTEENGKQLDPVGHAGMITEPTAIASLSSVHTGTVAELG